FVFCSSSRRRHTISKRDWSSDVCSSDLRTLVRDYDGATGIKINGDFYRLCVQETSATELPVGTAVTFKKFDGTTAIVTIAAPKEIGRASCRERERNRVRRRSGHKEEEKR